MTTIRIKSIDTSAPGSHRLIKQQRLLLAEHAAQVDLYNDAVDAFNAAREAAGYETEKQLAQQIEDVASTGDMEAVEHLTAQRQSLIDSRSPETVAGVQALRRELDAAREQLDAARDRYYEHLITRMTTDDGSPIEDALDLISEDDFQRLMKMDVEAVTVVPRHGSES